jgi:hypothetical protein
MWWKEKHPPYNLGVQVPKEAAATILAPKYGVGANATKRAIKYTESYSLFILIKEDIRCFLNEETASYHFDKVKLPFQECLFPLEDFQI